MSFQKRKLILRGVLVLELFFSCLDAVYANKKLSGVFPEQNISDDWTVRSVQKGGVDMYLVENYPKVPEKTAVNYAPPREENKIFDSGVLSQTCQQEGNLGGVLRNWIVKRLSSHYFINQEGILVE